MLSGEWCTLRGNRLVTCSEVTSGPGGEHTPDLGGSMVAMRAERATQARLSPGACSSSARGHAAERLEHNPHDSAPTRITRLVGRLGAMLGAGRT